MERVRPTCAATLWTAILEVQTHTHTPTHLHTYTPTHIHTHLHTPTHTYSHILTHTHTYSHTYLPTHPPTHHQADLPPRPPRPRHNHTTTTYHQPRKHTQSAKMKAAERLRVEAILRLFNTWSHLLRVAVKCPWTLSSLTFWPGHAQSLWAGLWWWARRWVVTFFPRYLSS